jgi:hypothetical protein
MTHKPVAGAPVRLVRLAPGVAEEEFERALQQRVPTLAGSLLTWLHDDWYALAPDVAPQMQQLGLDAEHVLRAEGAIGLQALNVPAFGALLGMRAARGDLPGSPAATAAPGADAAARDAAAGPPAVECDPPQFACRASYHGQPVDADWHLEAAGVLEAWALLPADAPAAIGAIKVGHIDTGYTPHPALGWGTPGGPWVCTGEGINYWKDRLAHHDPNAEIGTWDFSRPEHPDARDNHTGSHCGHGTRTASTIAGLYVPADGSLAHPYFGAAPGAAIVPYRITDSVMIDHVQDLLAKALHDAVARGCQVVNISLGAILPRRAVASAIDEAYEHGVIVCAAAGNVIHEVVYPGRYNRVLTVGGATTSDGRTLRPWSGASRGPYVDVSAPSDHIRRATTVLDKFGHECCLVKAHGDGTSFGTALTSGIATLWLARRGAELQQAYGGERWARVAAFKRLARTTATVPAGWNTAEYGTGVIHAGRLLGAPLPALAELHMEAKAWEPLDNGV